MRICFAAICFSTQQTFVSVKTYWRRLQCNIFLSSKTSWRRLEDIIARRLANTSWRHNCKTSRKHVLKTSWRRFRKTYCKCVLKTSSRGLGRRKVLRWRRLQDILKTSWKTRNVCRVAPSVQSDTCNKLIRTHNHIERAANFRVFSLQDRIFYKYNQSSLQISK